MAKSLIFLDLQTQKRVVSVCMQLYLFTVILFHSEEV